MSGASPIGWPQMTAPFTCTLFDLDGTIVDSAPGITASLAWTLEQLGLAIPSPVELLEWVGPPILDSFRDRLGITGVHAERALALYRSHYLTNGALDSAVYPGIPDLLRTIRDSGLALSLATSKPESLARTILETNGLDDCFDYITGASEDEVLSAKADVVAEALRRLTAGGFDVSNPVMVGDRHYDVLGAAQNGVPTIFVEWGYGGAAEQVGTIAVAPDAPALQKLLLG
jgi:phosphoglycolate phosphatase